MHVQRSHFAASWYRRDIERTVIEYFKWNPPFPSLLSLARGASWLVTDAVFCSTASPTPRIFKASIGTELFVKTVADADVVISAFKTGADDDDSVNSCAVLSAAGEAEETSFGVD